MEDDIRFPSIQVDMVENHRPGEPFQKPCDQNPDVMDTFVYDEEGILKLVHCGNTRITEPPLDKKTTTKELREKAKNE